MRGSPERGYFVPGCVGSGRWADFESCSRIHACGFRCFCRKVWFRARGAHISGKEERSRYEPIGVRGLWRLFGRFRRFWDIVREPKRKNKCKMLLISCYFLLRSTCWTLISRYFLSDFGISVRFHGCFEDLVRCS